MNTHPSCLIDLASLWTMRRTRSEMSRLNTGLPVETDSSRDLLNSDGFAVDVKDLAHKFLTAHGVSACMTVKHGYLRWE